MDRLIDAGILQRIAERFADDPEALRMLQYLGLGLTRLEMRERSGLSEKELGTSIRRFRRGAASFRP